MTELILHSSISCSQQRSPALPGHGHAGAQRVQEAVWDLGRSTPESGALTQRTYFIFALFKSLCSAWSGDKQDNWLQHFFEGIGLLFSRKFQDCQLTEKKTPKQQNLSGVTCPSLCVGQLLWLSLISTPSLPLSAHQPRLGRVRG